MRICDRVLWPAAALVLGLPLIATATELYVDPGGGGDFTTINAALAAAADGDTIVVACGTYREPLIDIRKNIAIRSETRDPECVTLDGQGTHLIMAGHYMGPSKYIEGFTFINGYQAALHDDAGALGCTNNHATVRNCIFRNNVCVHNSGGALSICANMGVEDCQFYDNTAQYSGGAIYFNSNGTTRIRGCLFVGNATGYGGSAYGLGGAIGMFMSTAVIDHCRFVGNRAAYGGAIAVSFGSHCQLLNCTLVGNHSLPPSSDSGSAEVWEGCTLAMDKCIVAFDDAGAGVVCRYGASAPALTCCDLFGNSGGDWVGCVSGELGQEGNICADPLFCEEAIGGAPLSIHANSPCAPQHSPCGELIGSVGVACDASAIEAMSWTGIKALYR